ncbi:hypothetical protein ACIQU5_29925 [Streptomyces sp. NPDC090306]|uniref:hypothetical protein n=1 Tax=unclassified Streptomyces TaxID=2593676 RepID=UPI0036EAE175
MAGRRRAWRSGAAALALALVALVGGCDGAATGDGTRADVRRVLDRRAAAVLAHDAGAYARTGTGTPFANIAAVPLTAWSYRLTSLHRTGDRATAAADLSYRLTGYDRSPVTVGRTLTLARAAGGRWTVLTDRPARKAPQQLWDQGKVTAVRGAHSLVLGVGQSGTALRGYADLADEAVPAVTRAWGTDWSRHVVVLVPGSLDAMAGLLASTASSYRGIAAVTTGEAGGTTSAPADRVIVNPDAYGILGALGRQVVLTHETTHVATRAHTGAATPLWLSEGYADWIGYRSADRTPREIAPELANAVAGGDAPTTLPTDKDFGFTSDSTELAQAYEGGWLACRLIADEWGEADLGAFYRSVGTHDRRAGAVEAALKDVLHTTPDEFTERWRAYVGEVLG